MALIKSVSGVRGIVDPACGQEVTLTAELAGALGRAFATCLRRRLGRSVRLIGTRDGRPSGQRLLEAFARGASVSGAEVVPLGVVTTPGTALGVAELSREFGVAGGVVVTASHNPQEWNGIKLLWEGGRAPTVEEASAVFALLDAGDFDEVPAGEMPAVPVLPDIHELHVERVLALVDVEAIRGRAFRVVLDSVNGAGGAAGLLLLERLGCTVEHVNADPAAGFPRNPEPTAANLAEFCTVVAGANAGVGFAQDPDADRLAIVDETGRYIGEEYTLALAAQQVFGARPGPAVANLSTSRMIDDLAATAGSPCTVHRSAVGEANVVEVMRQTSAHIGGEGNGGVIDPRVVLVRDSLVGMALVLQLLAEEGRPLSRIVDRIPRYTIIKQKFAADRERIGRVLEAVRHEFARERINAVDGVRIDWEAGWVHVRGSNTEPIMRVIAEARDEAAAQELIGRVRAVADRVA